MALHRFVIWSLAVLLCSGGAHAAGSVYSVRLGYDLGRLTLVEMHVTEGFPSADKADGPFKCRLVSPDGGTARSMGFEAPNNVCYDGIDPQTGIFRGGCMTLDKVEFLLFVPYDSGAKKMEFYDENDSLILSADLSKYSEPTKASASNLDQKGREAGNGIDEASAVKGNKIPADTRNGIESYIYPVLLILVAVVIGFFGYRRLRR
jgi:hypothetical protein